MKKKLRFLIIIAFIILGLISIKMHSDKIEEKNRKQCFSDRRILMAPIEMSSSHPSELEEKIMKDTEFKKEMLKKIRCKSGGAYSFIVKKDGLSLNCSKHPGFPEIYNHLAG